MAVTTHQVTVYKARDGKTFDCKDLAKKHDIEVGKSDLYEDAIAAAFQDFTKNDFFSFLEEHRDEIIELMGWENSDDEPNN